VLCKACGQGSGAASFSPDGSKILYTSSQSGRNELWTMNSDGSNQQQLTFSADPTAPDANAGSYSPDGSMIAYFGGYETEYGNVYTISADGYPGSRTKRTSCIDVGAGGRSATCDGPAWSPDGERIIFTSDMNSSGDGMIDPDIAIRTWVVNPFDGSRSVMFDQPLNYGARGWIP
jgi:Tol biopolymer transport system component